VTDVGQSQREEIDIVEKGKNYGWNIMEGSLTYSAGNQEGLEAPAWEYSQRRALRLSGATYIVAQFCKSSLRSTFIAITGQEVWAFQYDGITSPVNTLLANTGLNISSFGIGEDDELFFCALNGKIYTLMANDIPEFPLTIIVLALLIATTLLVTSIYRKHLS
jgi:hypothetical protein